MNKTHLEKRGTRRSKPLKDPLRWVVPTWIALVLIGCNVDDHLNSSARSLVSDNEPAPDRLASNRLNASHLSSSRLGANQLASNPLSSGPISPDTFSLADTDLLESDDGREVLTFLVSCALPEGITLLGEDSQGGQHEFFGELGLAPRWLDQPLNHRGKRWVSACLFARVNEHMVAVPFSARGPHSELAVTPDEQANWTLQEGAFYGMYFTPPDQPINWIACRGMDSEQAHQQLRDCAYPDPRNPGKTLCGFNFAGDCGRIPRDPGPVACEAFSPNGYYVHCADDAIFTGDEHADHDVDDDDGPAHIFRQVITTYVQP